MNDKTFDQDHITDRLDAWLDGELSSAELADFEAHIAACGRCRDEVSAARRVAELARAMREDRSEHQPGRDLWPGIAAAIKAQPAAVSQRHIDTNWFRGLAAALVLGLAFFGGMMLEKQPWTTPTVASVATSGQPHFEPGQIKDALPAPHFQLVSDDRLPDETRETLLNNLMIVNLAIREVQQALAEEPNNVQLRKLLRTLYEQENDILNRAERIASTRESTQVRSGI